jgi:nicotinate-nucleotide--dimethylbenzimidazole phosphoribosyltransferase
LEQIIASIPPLSHSRMEQARHRLDMLTKPQGSLGRLEQLAIQVAGITDQLALPLEKKAVIIMAGDHGVCAEQVSAYPQAVTAQMVGNYLNGGAAVNVFAKRAGADVFCVDMGVNADLHHPHLIAKKVARGTANMTTAAAMSAEQMQAAVMAGIEVMEQLTNRGYTLFALGEMGIGNTTSAAAITSCMLGLSPELTVGRGTGLDEDGLERKRSAVCRALAYHQPDAIQPLNVLAQLGGFEIAGMVGVCLGAGLYRVPVVIDGYISTAAALLAAKLSPQAASYWMASHRSEEPGHGLVLEALQMRPLLELGMRLGEGTGAALCLRIVESAVAILSEMATFTSAGISSKYDEENVPK